MKWAGRTIGIVQILLVSTHNNLRNTYLHKTEIEIAAPQLALHYYMINLIRATPRYHLMPTLLVTVTSSLFSGENWENTRSLLLSVFFFT